MRFDVLTVFPEFFESPLKASLFGKSLQKGNVSVHLHNIRDFATGKHRQVDDAPYGGGAGMVLKPGPLVSAINSIVRKRKSKRILLTPSGKPFHQKWAKELADYDQILLVCGRYEGIDERVRELAMDEEVSVGDYILNGGEAAALVLMETVVRLLPGVLGNTGSLSEESFTNGLLEYPQYTRPESFQGKRVPKVLLSGNREEIKIWRRLEALRKTFENRADLLPFADLTKEEIKYLQSLKKEDR